MSAVAYTIEQEMRAIVPRVLFKEPAKVIAFKCGATPYAAKAWKRGDNLPQAHHMLMLERAYPELAAEMRRLRALEAEHDPEAQRLAAQLVQWAISKAGNAA